MTTETKPTKKTTVTCVIARPGEDAVAIELAPGLDAIRTAIGCPLLERLPIAPEPITAFVDEEGLLTGKPWNRKFNGQPIAGAIVVTVFIPIGEHAVQRDLFPEHVDALVAALNLRVERMEPTPASMEEWEAITGQSPIQITDFDGNPV